VTLLLRIVFFVAGLATLGLGLLVDGEAWVAWVARNLAPDGALSPQVARQVAALRLWVFAAGVVLLAAGWGMRWLIGAYHALEGAMIRLVGLPFRAIAAGRPLASGLFRWSRSAAQAPREAFLLVLLLGIVLAMALWAQAVQPPFHADGINLQPPSNLLLYGKYATRTAAGFDLETFRISTGPAMLLPTALVYKIFGIHYQHAHKLTLAFFLAFLLLAYRALGRFYGPKTVLLGLLFFALNPSNIFYGPSNGYIAAGMGESPALLYFLGGALVWSTALERSSPGKLLLAGILWGLAFQSKWLFLFALPAVVAAWGILALAGRRLPSRVYLLPAAGLAVAPAVFFAMRVHQFGLRGELDHMERLWAQHAGRAAGFSAAEGQIESIFAFARPLITLAQVDFWAVLGAFLTLPAAVYAVILLKRRLDPLPLYLLTFTGIWALWWVLFSYDLPLQHLLYIWPFVQIYVAKLLMDGWQAAQTGYQSGAGSRFRPLLACLLAAIVLVIVGKTVIPLASDADAISRGSRTLTPAYREMMDYVNRSTEPDAVFSGWSWSTPWWIAIDANRTLKDRARYPSEQREAGPEYLMITPEWPVGPATPGWPNMANTSRWTQRQSARRQEFIDQQCTHLLTTGTEHTWSIYRVNPLATADRVHPIATGDVVAKGGREP
jgi:hypothetical protein